MSFSWQNLANQKPILGLAPMDGITDFPFRHIHATKGKPDVCFTEFTHVEGIWHGAVHVLDNFLYHQSHRPIIAQIYGNKPDYFYKAAIMVCAMGFDGVDINMGCPAKNVTHSGGGAALIGTPELAKQIIQAVQQGVQDWANGITLEDIGVPGNKIEKINQIHTFSTSKDVTNLLATTSHRFWSGEEVGHILTTSDKNNDLETERLPIPVSVKTRIGIEQPETEKWISHLLEINLANITLHGRTLKQMYTGAADYSELAKAAALVKTTNTTFLLNGDIKSLQDAHQKIADTKSNGTLIGRAAMGNPWIWTPNHHYSPQQRLQDALEHATIHAQTKEPRHFIQMRKHFGFYLKDFPGANDLRVSLIRTNNLEEASALIQTALTSHSNQILN